MRSARSGWLPVALWALTLAGLAGALVIVAIDPGVLGPGGEAPLAASLLFIVAFATVGAVIARRQPANAVGWLMGATALAYSVGGFTSLWGQYALVEHPGSLPAGATMDWVSSWVWGLGVGLGGTFLLLVFPNGRLVSRRWRPVAWVAAAATVMLVAAPALSPGPLDGAVSRPVTNPVGIDGAGPFLAVIREAGALGEAVALLAALLSLAVRFRRSASMERQQLKWLAYAGAVVAVGIVAAVVVEAWAQRDVSNLANFLITGSLATLPPAIGIAVLRHRLYDIDVVVNRTLVYGALTATLAGAYLGGVLLLGLVVRPLTGSSNLAIAGSTLAVAALFRPARARIQRVVDRRFYRRRYDAAQTLASFSVRLRDEVDLEALGADLRGVVSEALQPAHVSLWLRTPGTGR